ncbi:aldo/keto reductase [Microbacterium atlanticum]|uniref:aldo/keto reductase n=1 Tax=Microbacterium atlanticum TaxID=2782168 RepID=UPI001887E6F9|nr:aldo/keto reductase [Microbacterium atlanticum]
MKYNQLGDSGMNVSQVILGTATFGISPEGAAVDELVGHAIDSGVTLFDTSNSYGNQPDYSWPGATPWQERASSEELLGKALADATDEILVASKVGEPLGQARIDGPFVGHLGRDHVLEQAALSLKRLGRDHLDIYYAHQPDPETPAEEIVGVFNDLIDRGDIRAWAISNFTHADTEAILDAVKRTGLRAPIVHQCSYSVARRDRAEDVIPSLESAGIPMYAYSPLGMGLLAGRAAAKRDWGGHRRWGGPGFTDAQVEAAGAFEDAAAQFGHEPADLAIAWLLRKRPVLSVIVGSTSVRHLSTACAAVDIDLTPEQVAAIDAIRFP